MKLEDLEKDVTNMIADVVEMRPDQIDPDANLVEDLGMDSMMALEILAMIERKYKTKIPEENLAKITTVNNAITLAKQYIA